MILKVAMRVVSLLLAVTVAVTAISFTFWILLTITGLMVPEPCKLNTDLCLDLRALSSGKAALMVALLGASLSFVGTIALVVTIVLTARSTASVTQALEHARTASSIELRPYVHILHPIIIGVVDSVSGEIVGYIARTTLKNSGVSFATSVRMNSNYWIGEGALPDYFSFPSADQGDDSGSIVGDKEVFSQTDLITLEEMEFIFQGRKNLHVWCWVEYRGTLSKTVYRSEFHAKMSVWREANGNIRSEYYFHPKFNGVDELSFRPPATQI